MSDPHSLKKELEGWKAQLNLSFENRKGKTVLSSRSQSGPLTVQRPFYPEGDVCHLYLLHPPGGIVGGDELHINASVKEQADILITTPGATKFYRNNGKLAKQIQTIKIFDGGCLEWFPQENIFFDDTHTQLITQVELEKTANFIGWEVNCYGRPASGDLFKKGKVDTQLRIIRDGVPLMLDRLKIDGIETLKSPASLKGFSCFGTFIATGVNKELLEKSRQAIDDIAVDQHIGITCIDDILVARCLGQYAEQISITFKLIWAVLRPNVLKRQACYPRIWAT